MIKLLNGMNYSIIEESWVKLLLILHEQTKIRKKGVSLFAMLCQ